ncbi:MAG: bifunctional oligoribonuclease/PAP phosphatase NrnA [FCB group bacterium]|jgi:phosphoesterase RecJ-like protein
MIKNENINSEFRIQNSELFKNCYKALIESKKLIISTHENPDGDAIGSALALYFYCRHRGIDTKILIHSPIPYNLKFISGIEALKKYNEEVDKSDILTADTIFVVDLNESSRLGSVAEAINQSAAKKVVIDHHLPSTNPEFRIQNTELFLSNPEASSTGELIYKMLKCDSDLKIGPEMAEVLYTAIMTDTGSFRFEKTGSDVHRIVADLIDCGADPVKIYNEYYNIIPANAARLLGEALAGMEFYYDGQLCIMTLTKEIFQKTNTTLDDVEGIVEHTVTLKGVKAGVLITERIETNYLTTTLSKGEGELKIIIKLSFRSKAPVNIRAIALQFGGGGHEQAAGAKIMNANLIDVKKSIIEKFANVFS